MARALALTAAALAAFTALVLAGALTGIDDWAIDHVMPALDPHSHAGIVSWSGLWISTGRPHERPLCRAPERLSY